MKGKFIVKRKLIKIFLVFLCFLSLTFISKDNIKNIYIKLTLYKPTIITQVDNNHKYTIVKDKYNSDVTIFLPISYNDEENNKWIIFAHGQSGTNLDLMKLKNENLLLEPLLDEGFVIVAPNYRNDKNWGNQQGIEDLVEAYSLGMNNYNLEEKPYLIVQSMGSLIGLNAIAKGYIQPKAVVGIYPVTNLEYEYKKTQERIAMNIDKAYDIKSPIEFEEKTNGYDPYNDYSREQFKDINMLLIASYEDEVVPREDNSDLFAKTVNELKGNIKVFKHEGNHGDKTAFNVKEIISFFNEQ